MRKLLTVVLVLLASATRAQSPCDGKITDKLDRDMNPAAVTKPVAGQSYVDPVFGTLITRISNANPSEGQNAVIKSLYATMRGWNSDDSLIIAWHRGGSGRVYEIYDGDMPYTHRDTVDLYESVSGTMEGPSDIEQVWWSNTEPLVLYYPSGSNGAKIIKHTLNLSGADTAVVHHNFSDLCANDWTFSMGGDPYQSSDTGDQIVAVKCFNAATGKDLQIIYNITDDVVESSGVNLWYDNASAGIAGWALPDGTGAFFQCHNACDTCVSPEGCTSYPIATDLDLAITGHITAIYRNYREHQALAKTPGGYNTFNRVQFDQVPYGSLISYRLDTGAATTIIGTDNGWGYPSTSTHVSSGAANGSGWVAVGSVADGTGSYVLNNELLWANVYTGEVCRAAHLRTTGRDGPWGYWGEAHSQISKDGYRVLFSSDWLSSTTVDLYVADLRPQNTTVITILLPNGVKDEAYSYTLQALGGLGAPYTWTKTVGTWPAGLNMSSGGILSGTPTGAETQVVTVQACDADSPPECDTQQLTITTQERPTITTASPLPGATVGTAYSQSLVATGGVGPRTWNVSNGTICNGLQLATDGTISQTPITLQTCNFTARVTDSHAQPISATKDFALTVSLPAACQPGGSSICMRTEPAHDRVLVRYGQSGLPRDASCDLVLKQGGSQVDALASDDEPSRRHVLFTGLAPSTVYTLETTCAGFDPSSTSVTTLATPSGGNRSVPITFSTPPIPGVAKVKAEWGSALVTENTQTQSPCDNDCSLTLSLAAGIYKLRHSWLDSGDAPLAQSEIRYLRVE